METTNSYRVEFETRLYFDTWFVDHEQTEDQLTYEEAVRIAKEFMHEDPDSHRAVILKKIEVVGSEKEGW